MLQQQGGSQTINLNGTANAGFGEAGPDEPWYDPSIFSQPGNAWGNTGRNQFRGPLTWNLDASVFRMIPFGHYHLELRVESQNVLNHPQWANPVTGFTDPNFMRIRSYAGGAQGTLARTAQGAAGREVRVLRMEWAVVAFRHGPFFRVLLPASGASRRNPWTYPSASAVHERWVFMHGNLAAAMRRVRIGVLVGVCAAALAEPVAAAQSAPTAAGAAGRPVSPCRAGDDSAGVQ